MKILNYIFIFLFSNSCESQIESIEELVNINEKIIVKKDFPFYLIGDPYFIDGIKYEPKEDYNYSEIGKASYFTKKSHGQKTANNEIIDITSLTASHKTLPLRSAVRVTNLKNGVSITVRVNDRGPKNNSDIISLSIVSAKLLDFYNENTTQVKIEILEEESKQLKLVNESINTDLNLETISAAPTSEVKIESID